MSQCREPEGNLFILILKLKIYKIQIISILQQFTLIISKGSVWQVSIKRLLRMLI
jgi:hypothetical protein